jgi:pheromone shutdown protein TraB
VFSDRKLENGIVQQMKSKKDFVIELLVSKGYKHYLDGLEANKTLSSRFESIEENKLVISGILNPKDREGILKELKNADEFFIRYNKGIEGKKKRERILKKIINNLSVKFFAIILFVIAIIIVLAIALVNKGEGEWLWIWIYIISALAFVFYMFYSGD